MNKNIRYLVMDVDGTLTDGKIYMGPSGEVMKAFDIKDGYGIHNMLIPNNIIPVIITGRKSPILENRCNELGISDLFQGVKDKITVLTNYLNSKGSNLSEVAYIGDDLNDMECMDAIIEAQGLVGCPSDAVQQIKDKSHFISSKKGGDGAVRDFIERLVKT